MFKLIVFLLSLQYSSQYTQIRLNGFNYAESAINEFNNVFNSLINGLNENYAQSATNEFNQFFNGLMDELSENYDDRQFAFGLMKREPDQYFNAKQMVEYRGFKFEEHPVTTQDCYVLSLHRIINPRDNRANKVPILLQHGLEDSSTAFMINNIQGRVDDNDQRNLAFALAKIGYDVWLGNFRGNDYSRRHTRYTTRNPEFWKFTFDNHALQDLPAMIGYIQDKTDYDQIAYLGYSQGTMAMFELLAMKPEVKNALSANVNLAPVAFVKNIRAPFRYFAYVPGLIERLVHTNSQLAKSSKFQKRMVEILCRSFRGVICKKIMDIFGGYSTNQLNSTRIPVYLTHIPAGTSTSNVVHFAQLIRTDTFSMFDHFNERINLECYGTTKPPRIPLEKISMNSSILLFNSINDNLANLKDLSKLKQSLKVNFFTKTVEYKEFSHADFVYSQNAYELVNKHVIDFLKNRQPLKSVNPNQRLRFKQFNERNCVVANKKSYCLLNLKSVLQNIIQI